MSARAPHPVRSAAPSFDALAPLGDDLDHREARNRDRIARMAFDEAADRFARTPGPAEYVRQVADDRLSHGEKTFAAGLGGLVLLMTGVFGAALLRHFGIC